MKLVGPNPSGLCECGCGEQTKLARKTDARHGWVRGEPVRYIFGHGCRTSPHEYAVEDRGYDTPCWVWQWSTGTGGYGRLRGRAHRVYWQRANGPVPDGLVLDHLCRVRACVNPDHLEPVTHAENIRRGSRVRLTAEAVREIRQRQAVSDCAPWALAVELAPRYGVTVAAIASVVYGKNWKDIAA